MAILMQAHAGMEGHAKPPTPAACHPAASAPPTGVAGQGREEIHYRVLEVESIGPARSDPTEKVLRLLREPSGGVACVHL